MGEVNESVWSVGLLAVLAVTRKWFKFSTAAIDGGEVGAAFLGSQGDPWDAQKDMLSDGLGAICCTLLYAWLRWRPRENRNHSEA